MATTEAALHPAGTKTEERPSSANAVWPCAALTIAAILIHGYHPYVEDGGVYLAGVKRVLDPKLYPYWSDFVTTHLKFSLFARMAAALVRVTHCGLMGVMFGLYAATIWLTLYAAWLLISRCTESSVGRAGAVTLLALTITIPVAGTSLMLMDPYVTARSFSTPFGILMLVFALDARARWTSRQPVLQSVVKCAACFIAAALMHPLMAVYSLGGVVLLIAMSPHNRMARIAAGGGACAFAITLAAVLERLSPVQSLGYAEAAHSRTYWFLGLWHWYELIGLIGPLVVLGILWRRRASGDARTVLLRMATVSGALSVLVAALFARTGSATFEVAKLQPLRMYQTIYILMLLALGAELGERLLKRGVLRWAALCVTVGGAMAYTQYQTFPNSSHIEAPWRAPHNGWRQAFEWARTHTATDAVFALDARYIDVRGEDSQNFRAIAERSAMPDYEKDGGIASIAPELTAQWLAGQSAQAELDRGVGPAEIERLRAYAVDWIIVPRDTPVAFQCSYWNRAVKVCRLP